jgi:hypothetical protein
MFLLDLTLFAAVSDYYWLSLHSIYSKYSKVKLFVALAYAKVIEQLANSAESSAIEEPVSTNYFITGSWDLK